MNAAMDALDRAFTDNIDIDVTSGNVTVTTEEYQKNIVFNVIGATTAGRTVTLPTTVKRLFVVVSQVSDATEVIEIINGTASVFIPPRTTKLLWTDGTTNSLVEIMASTDIGVLPDVTASTYSFIAEDVNGYRPFNSGSAQTATIEPDSTTDLRIGSILNMEQKGAGVLTVAAGAGVTLNSSGGGLTALNQFSVISAIKTAADTWTVYGALA
jgi:hypothetical protein